MEKIVENGERITHVTLDGGECAVMFSSVYRVFAIKSDSRVAVALESGKAEGEDGVMICPSGGAIIYPHMRLIDTVYLTGTGNVTVCGLNEVVNPFGASGSIKADEYDDSELRGRIETAEKDISALLTATLIESGTVPRDENKGAVNIPMGNVTGHYIVDLEHSGIPEKALYIVTFMGGVNAWFMMLTGDESWSKIEMPYPNAVTIYASDGSDINYRIYKLPY